ncbi:uncharacterized protein [Euphorbia lathyris]|uniref:uncharacterized protein isoform X3 n=1 Tax=Euphorbia lathyris TaxID=212925 RepID=UPI003313CF6B
MEEGGRDTEKPEVMELLEEILIEILLRLPVKSLLKFKTVCKSWRSIINSPKFIKQHLNRAYAIHYNQHKNFLGLLIPSWDASNPLVLYKEISDGVVHAKQFDFPYQLPASPHEEIPVQVCNFCDGLICFNMYGLGILLWNPSFPLEYKIIRHSDLDVGFPLMGYDSSTDDYKIVSIPSYSSKDRFPRRYFFVEVCSLKSSSWRKRKISKNFFTYKICQLKGIYTRNHLHWIATRNSDEDDVTELIVYFDLVEERLDHVNLPTRSYNDWTLLIYKECFGIVGANSEGQEELWVLQDYCGMKSSWNKVFKIAPLGIGVHYHSCFTRTGEILMHNGDLGLRCYDIKDGSFKNVLIQGDDIIDDEDGYEDDFYASPYVESLVSPRLYQMEEGRRDTEKAEVMELLEEILIEILLRLPVKSLLKFKTVCKSWRSIINSTKFIKQHLNRAHAVHYNQHKNFLGLLIPSWDASNPLVLYKEISDGVVHAKQFDFPYQLPASPHEEIPVQVCNFCDGLICFNMYGRGILLWNPSFPLEYKIIRHSDLDVGFPLMGYDSSTDDYKIVSIPSYSSKERFPRRYFFVEVFSLKSSSWRKRKISKNFFTYKICQLKGIYTRNHLHWIATRNFDEDDATELIVYFDLVEERLDHVNLPTRSYNDWTLLIYKECLGIVGANSEGQEELWVLQDYCGMKSSWNKIFKIAPLGIGVHYNSCFTRTGEILMHNGDLGLRCYDIKDGSFKNVLNQGDDIIDDEDGYDDSFYASPYVESLVSPRLYEFMSDLM